MLRQLIASLVATPRGARLFFLLTVLPLLLLGLLLSRGLGAMQFKRKEAQCKQNLHAIQLAVERYAVDQQDSDYPADVNTLVGSSYLPQMPENPFTHLPMRVVPVDAQLEALSPPERGDFGYLPHTERDGSIAGYDLVLFCPEP